MIIRIRHQRQSPSLLIVIISISSILADDGLAMMTGHVMELDTVSVEVVEDGQTDLVTLPVIRLGPARAGIYSHLILMFIRLSLNILPSSV